MDKKTVFLLSAIAAFLLLSFYCLWRQSAPEPDVYEYVYPIRSDVVRKVRINGHVDARNQVTVYPQTTGILSRIYVQNGDKVQKGRKLAEIDVNAQIDATQEYIANEQNAQVSLEQAQRDEKRAKALYEKGAVSAREYENAVNALKMAEKALAVASSRIRANGEVSVIYAPIEGLISGMQLVAGAAVSGQTPICGIFNQETLIFIGRADETDVYDLKEGMYVTLIPGADKNSKIAARLTYISERGENVNGITTFEIRADILDTGNLHLRMGYSANAEIDVERKENALSVEEAYVYYDPEPFVWMLSSNPKDRKHQKWEKVYVTTGISDGVNIEIEGNIPEGSIIRGHRK